MYWCNNVALRNLDLYIVVYIVHRVVSFWDWIALCFFPAPIPDAHGRFVLVGQGIWQPRMCNLILPFYTNMQCLQISFVTSPPECNVLNPKTLSHRAAVRGHPDGWDDWGPRHAPLDTQLPFVHAPMSSFPWGHARPCSPLSHAKPVTRVTGWLPLARAIRH